MGWVGVVGVVVGFVLGVVLAKLPDAFMGPLLGPLLWGLLAFIGVFAVACATWKTIIAATLAHGQLSDKVAE